MHSQSDTSLHLRITTFRMHDCSSHDTRHHERASAFACARFAEQPGSRRVRWCLSGRSAKSGSRHTRQRLGGSRKTHRQPQTYQRSWRLSAGQPGLRHAESSKPAKIRYSSNADRSSSSSTAADAQLSETSSGAAGTAATRIPSLCSMWFRPRPHAAHGSDSRGTTAAPWKRCAAAPSMHLLRKRYSAPKPSSWRHLSEPTTTRTSGRCARWMAHCSATSSWLAAGASWRSPR